MRPTFLIIRLATLLFLYDFVWRQSTAWVYGQHYRRRRESGMVKKA